jgi:hypothetical protein
MVRKEPHVGPFASLDPVLGLPRAALFPPSEGDDAAEVVPKQLLSRGLFKPIADQPTHSSGWEAYLEQFRTLLLLEFRAGLQGSRKGMGKTGVEAGSSGMRWLR